MKTFSHYWPCVRGIHRSPVNSPHKGQWRGTLIFSLICAWTNGWVNNRDTSDLRHHRALYDVTGMIYNTIRCHYHITFIKFWVNKFLKNTHYRHLITRPWGRDLGCFCKLTSDLSSVSVTEMLCAISCYIAPLYNGTRWYAYRPCKHLM